MSLIQELKDAEFFKYVEDEQQLNFIIQVLNNNLKDGKTLYFPNTSYYYDVAFSQNWSEKGKTIDFMALQIDAEGLFRGGLSDALSEIQILFTKRNLKFDFKNEVFSAESNSYIKHEITINNKPYLIAEGDFNRAGGAMHYLREIEKIISEQLFLQGSTEQVHKIISYFGEMIWYVIMEEKHYVIFEKYKHEYSESQLISDFRLTKFH